MEIRFRLSIKLKTDIYYFIKLTIPSVYKKIVMLTKAWSALLKETFLGWIVLYVIVNQLIRFVRFLNLHLHEFLQWDKPVSIVFH